MDKVALIFPPVAKMDALVSTQLINLLGFAFGVLLYALLLAMTLRHRVREQNVPRLDVLLLTTAVLGLLWNAVELVRMVGLDFRIFDSPPFLEAVSHSAFGFLPAAIVHLTWQSSDDGSKQPAVQYLTVAAYALSGVAAALHFQSALVRGVAPSFGGLQILTFGYLAILLAFVLFTFRHGIRRKTVLATALAVFAVSALHLSHPHEAESGSWLVELVGHQASIPLALAILYQDFRFAFADLFLKRALSLLLLTFAAVSLYVFIAAPLLANPNLNGTQTAAITVGLWVATALVYPKIHNFAVWLVDKLLLRRVDYAALRDEINQKISECKTGDAVLETISGELATALTAGAANWHEVLPHGGDKHLPDVTFTANGAEVCIPTVETPFYHVVLQNFTGGRRLLSDEIEMLKDVAILAARRIDALRVSHERCEQEIREQEIGKLASEAELRALRAQLNPHFLFNALTTIGYLIQTAPDKALDTLMRLTQLLRGVLRSTGEFSTLGDELKLIESYLEIERARFEERLAVKIEVAPELMSVRVPSLILQPLVENAVKHGISPKKNGGEVTIKAQITAGELTLEVTDTGAGVDDAMLAKRRQNGVGLSNIENRLRSYYGANAELKIESQSELGTTARIVLPQMQTVNKTVEEVGQM